MQMKKKGKILLTFVIFSIIQSGWGQTPEQSPEATSETYTLESLLDATKQNHPELLKLQEEYKRSLLDVQDAWWALGPTVDMQISGTYMVNPPVGPVYLNVDELLNSISWGNVKPTSNGQYVKVFDGMENTLYNIQLGLTQPIFTWGKITNAIKLYKQISNIKQSQITQQTQQLETELKTRLISLYYLKNILAVIDEEEGYTSRMVQVSEEAEKSGMLLHQEVVDAKIQAKELEIARQDLKEQITNQLLELERTSGISGLSLDNIDYNFVTDFIKEFEQLLAQDPDQLEKVILSGNQTSIKMLTQLHDISKTAEEIAKGYENWKPDFALQMTGGYSGSRVPFFEPNYLRKDDYSLNISIGIKTTIWDGGKKIRDVSRKKSEVQTAQINKDDARSNLAQTFKTQWNAAQVCNMKIEYQDLKIESASGKIAQKQQIYESGYGSETDLLSAKIERCNAQIEKEKQALSRAAACLTIEFLLEK